MGQREQDIMNRIDKNSRLRDLDREHYHLTSPTHHAPSYVLGYLQAAIVQEVVAAEERGYVSGYEEGIDMASEAPSPSEAELETIPALTEVTVPDDHIASGSLADDLMDESCCGPMKVPTSDESVSGRDL